MGFHTFDPAETDRLEDPTRFRFCSREELLQQLPREPSARILDIGSGTGFYTNELAPFVGHIYGLDLQPEMNRKYREQGVPENVSLVTADAEELPFQSRSFDGVVSTMTFHESTTEQSIAELYRVLNESGRVVVVDWSRDGRGESGPPVAERFTASTAEEMLTAAGFEVQVESERSETFMIVAERPT